MAAVPSPWRLRLLALGAGLAAALAHPPFGLLLGLLGYAVILRLADAEGSARPLRSAFLRGWLAGLGYFAVGTWWIGEAFLVDAENQAWMAPIAVALMAGGLALFWGLGALAYRWARPSGDIRRILVFAGTFTAVEWLRGHLFTGFPWNLPGESWRAGSAMSQAASFAGAYGLTWITLAVSAAFAFVTRGRSGRHPALAALCTLAVLQLGGLWRLAHPPATAADAPLIRIVQADIPQEAKYDAARFNAILERYLTLTAQPATERPDVVVWPEGAIPASADEYLAPGTWTREAITAALQPGQILLVGAYHLGGGAERPTYYNGLIALRRDGDELTTLAIYDKHRLVPFGEYLPADSLLTALGVKTLAHLGEGFSPGPRPAPMALTGVPVFQPLICYEALFPELARPSGRGPKPAWILNISNDAWFGKTSGPLQHLNLSSFRAIENGLPMIRSTPTGVSSLVDSLGRPAVGKNLGLGQSGNIDVRLPSKTKETFYSRWGSWIMSIALLISTLSAVMGSIDSTSKNHHKRVH